jgi:5'-deoxynucleotidase YfbR-like HD superfamily hydrolase
MAKLLEDLQSVLKFIEDNKEWVSKIDQMSEMFDAFREFQARLKEEKEKVKIDEIFDPFIKSITDLPIYASLGADCLPSNWNDRTKLASIYLANLADGMSKEDQWAEIEKYFTGLKNKLVSVQKLDAKSPLLDGLIEAVAEAQDKIEMVQEQQEAGEEAFTPSGFDKEITVELPVGEEGLTEEEKKEIEEVLTEPDLVGLHLGL